MEESPNLSIQSDTLHKDAPLLAKVLKEMKEGLDVVRNKLQALTAKVKENQYPTADGFSYLEAKHLLLLSYCQSIVYYTLRKAKGLPMEDHPVVRSLVEIRLFLEKIRPIDKKLEYQIRKLTTDSGRSTEKADVKESKVDETSKSEDLLKYRPNPDLLVGKFDPATQDGIYRPPKFQPATMEEDKMSKQDKLAHRREKETLRKAKQSPYMRELIDSLEDKPEEVREDIGTESREIERYKAKMEERARREEEIFIRAPQTRKEKQQEKHLKKLRNGLLGLTDGFYDEVKSLPLEDDDGLDTPRFSNHSSGRKKFNKNKRKR